MTQFRFNSKLLTAPTPTVIVNYDARGKRASKTFSNPYLARRFFLAKEKAGKNPAVKKGN